MWASLGSFCLGLYASWTCVTFSFTKWGKFSAIIYSDRSSIPCSLSSPSAIPVMWMLLCLVVSQRSLILSSFRQTESLNSDDFHSQMPCRLLFLSLMLWVGDPGLGLRHHPSQEGLLQLRYPSNFSATVYGCRGQPSPCLCSSYQSLCGFYCKSLVIILLFSGSSVGYSGWLLYSLALNPVWCQGEVSVAST